MIDLQSVGLAITLPDGAARTILGPTTLRITERRVAIIGANGSGKSTLIRLMNGLAAPSTGSVRVLGVDTLHDGAKVRARVGMLFADPDAQVLMPTPVEDVALSLRHLPRRERRARAVELLTEVGLAEHLHQPVATLSGGQKQLLALTAVLATEPEILLADEPTTLLDLRWRAHVNGLLDGLAQQVVIVTHDLDAAARAERVIVVDEGRIVADDVPDEAIAYYRALMATVPPEIGTGQLSAERR